MEYKFRVMIICVTLSCLLASGVWADSVNKRIYVDGNFVGQVTADAALSFPFTRLTIGAEGSAWYPYNGLVGMIDEFAVYDGILTDTQISTHYSAGPAGYTAAVTSDNPLLYLKFEDATSDNNDVAYNSGSADINGIYIGAVGLSTGYTGNAAVLHGAADGSGDCVDVPDETGDLSLTDITVELWVNTTQASDYPRLFQHNNGDEEMGGYGAMFVPDTNAIGLIGGGSTGYITQEIADGSWHHIVITYNSIEPGPYEAEVKIDDPVVYMQFEAPHMPMDSSVNHYWTAYGQAVYAEKAGGIGNSLYLDSSVFVQSGDQEHQESYAAVCVVEGGPAYEEYGDNYAFAPNDITFELWIKSVSELPTSEYAMLFQQIGPWTREPNAPGLGVDGNELRVLAGSNWWYTGVEAPFDEQWHQIVVTYDEQAGGDPNSLGIELYIDGSLAASNVITDPNGEAKLGPELDHLMVGGENNRGWVYNCFGGYVDEFAIYEGVLSAERIAAHYAAWQPGTCQEIWDRGYGMPADINRDCLVNFVDFSQYAIQWLLCNDPNTTDPDCVPNW